MNFFLNSAEEKERMEWQRNLEAKKNESLGKKETEVCANNPILVYKHTKFLWYLSVFWIRSICRLQIVLPFLFFCDETVKFLADFFRSQNRLE
jgi:hypothetical protein